MLKINQNETLKLDSVLETIGALEQQENITIPQSLPVNSNACTCGCTTSYYVTCANLCYNACTNNCGTSCQLACNSTCIIVCNGTCLSTCHFIER